MARYGPKEEMPKDMNEDFFKDQDKWEADQEGRMETQTKDFKLLIKDLLAAEDPNDLPSIMSSRMELMLNMRGYEGVNLLKDTIQKAEEKGDEEHLNHVMVVCDYIVSFTEEFVEQAKSMDDANKELLGKILKKISAHKTSIVFDETLSDKEREEGLDALLQEESQNFTPGFLRHMERECVRIENAPKKTPEATKMLHTVRLIHARVVEELGKELGEGAQILGQLLGYDDRDERIAVLEAGLTVRGKEFAIEMSELTGEALGEFKKMEKGDADPELVARVEELHKNILDFVESSWE